MLAKGVLSGDSIASLRRKFVIFNISIMMMKPDPHEEIMDPLGLVDAERLRDKSM
jgi:hypothetical protein